MSTRWRDEQVIRGWSSNDFQRILLTLKTGTQTRGDCKTRARVRDRGWGQPSSRWIDDCQRHTTRRRLGLRPDRPLHTARARPRAHQLDIVTEPIAYETSIHIRALKGRLGYFARPEGRDEPFRARALAEPALQRTDNKW